MSLASGMWKLSTRMCVCVGVVNQQRRLNTKLSSRVCRFFFSSSLFFFGVVNNQNLISVSCKAHRRWNTLFISSPCFVVSVRDFKALAGTRWQSKISEYLMAQKAPSSLSRKHVQRNMSSLQLLHVHKARYATSASSDSLRRLGSIGSNFLVNLQIIIRYFR